MIGGKITNHICLLGRVDVYRVRIRSFHRFPYRRFLVLVDERTLESLPLNLCHLEPHYLPLTFFSKEMIFFAILQTVDCSAKRILPPFVVEDTPYHLYETKDRYHPLSTYHYPYWNIFSPSNKRNFQHANVQSLNRKYSKRRLL